MNPLARTTGSWLAMPLLAFACATGLAAGAPAASPPDELEEVEVEGLRPQQLRQAMVEVEERFYEAFNELNVDDDFDVHCKFEALVGTRLRERYCRPVFYSRAEEEQARAFLEGDVAPPPELVALERWSDYQKNALQVINRNPKLRELLRERAALEKRFEAARPHWPWERPASSESTE